MNVVLSPLIHTLLQCSSNVSLQLNKILNANYRHINHLMQGLNMVFLMTCIENASCYLV